MYVDDMTKACNDMSKSCKKKGSSSVRETSFLGKMMEKMEDNTELSEAGSETAFSAENGITGGGYSLYDFGAAKEEYLKRSWSKSCLIGNQRAKRKYWKEREERRRRLRKQLEQLQAKRAMWKRVLEMEKSQAIHENEMISRRETGLGQQTGYVRTELEQAYAAYEAYAVLSVAINKLRSQI